MKERIGQATTAGQKDREASSYENLRNAVNDLGSLNSHLDDLIRFVEHGHTPQPTEETKSTEPVPEPPMDSVVEVLNNAPDIISKRSSEVHAKIEQLQNFLS